jgi:hypothetical protein
VTWRRPTWRLALGTAAIWLAINLLLLHRFPTVYVDEAENANHAYNLAYHHQALFSLYDNFYPPQLAELRHAWPVVIRPFYGIPLAAFIKLIGFSLARARLFSLLAAFLALLAVYRAGELLEEPVAGYFAMGILATRFAFLYSADRIRPEALLCLCGLIVFIGVLHCLRYESPLWGLMPGIFAGLAPGIHTNGAVLILPVVVLLLWNKKYAALGVCVLGWLSGALAFAALADWDHFLPGVHALFFQEFSTPTLLKVHGNLFRALAVETERYFGGWDFYDWRGGWVFHLVNGWQVVLAAAAVAAGCLRRDHWRIPAQFAALLALGYAFGVGQKAFPYLSVLEPYFALAVAAWLVSQERPGTRSIVFSGLMLVAALPLGKFPMLLILSLAVLPRKAFQIALLIALLSFVMYAETLRAQLLSTLAAFHTYWPISAAAGFLAFTLRTLRDGKTIQPTWRSHAWAALALTTAGTLIFVQGIAAYTPSFDTICATFNQKMKPGAKVVGPQTLWLGMSAYDYRDIGGLVWYRLLTGERDLTRPLKKFHPDYVVIGQGFASQIGRLNQMRHAKGLQGPTGLFPWKHRVLSTLDVGPVYGGRLALIEMNWDE